MTETIHPTLPSDQEIVSDWNAANQEIQSWLRDEVQNFIRYKVGENGGISQSELTGYATGLVAQGVALLGAFYGRSEQEQREIAADVVKQMLKKVLIDGRPECQCPTCQARRAAESPNCPPDAMSQL